MSTSRKSHSGWTSASSSSSSSSASSLSSHMLLLENISEDLPVCLPVAAYACSSSSGSASSISTSTTSSCEIMEGVVAGSPPEAPLEPMEFLSRSWSASATEMSKALAHRARNSNSTEEELGIGEYYPPTSASLSFASSVTAQLVMDRILARKDSSPLALRRNSHSSGPMSLFSKGSNNGSPPISAKHDDELTFCRSFSAVRGPFQGKSIGRWLKDMKEKKKEATRNRNAQVHAALSVAGVAAAVAAIAAATASNSNSEESQSNNKVSAALASAAALVAAQCAEAAESMGAGRDQVSSVVNSAVGAKTPGDVITLTAAAATALRGAATLKARTLQAARNHTSSTVIPYEQSVNATALSCGDSVSEDGETEPGSLELIRQGFKFLKRSRKGKLQWREVCVYLNKQLLVIVKSKGEYFGGAVTKEKKRIVEDLYTDLPAWPGRALLDDGDERRYYFGIKTDEGVMELECRTEVDYRLWTEGILRLLYISQQQQQR